MPGELRLDRPADAVARLTISNPDRGNALDHQILDAIASTLPELDSGIETRCVLFTGDGSIFSAGYDIGDIPDQSFSADAEALVAHPFHAAMDAISAHPFPVVAAINGHALGGGLELAIRCDIRICAEGAKLGMPPAKLGLIYSHTGLQRFIDVIGIARTKEMFLVGRNVDASHAEGIGLVNQVVAPDDISEAGVALAAEIAANAPIATRGNKRMIETLARNPVVDAELERELIELRRSCFDSEDFREGIRAFAEKRPPRWTGE